MIRGAEHSSTLIKRPGSGQIIDLLSWVIKGGPARWCDDITYDADKTITQPFITANNFTVNAAKTLTLSPLVPLIVVADTVDISGTIEASGKGCPAVSGTEDGESCGSGWFLFKYTLATGLYKESRNHCLCGSGGGSSSSNYRGGGAFKDGGSTAVGGDCDLSDAELKELLLSPLFDILRLGLGGSGGANTGDSGAGGGSILLIAKTIILGAAASLLANGVGTSNACGGGGGGFVGLVGQSISDGGATITAAKGVASSTGWDGGVGATVQIEV